jgi:hypothetical protein
MYKVKRNNGDFLIVMGNKKAVPTGTAFYFM